MAERNIVIVGGGVIGLTVAMRMLQEDSNAQVTVLERGQVGAGASGYAGAIDIPYYQTDFHRKLVLSSWDWYANFIPARNHRLAVPISWCVKTHQDETELQEKLMGRLCVRAQSNSLWMTPNANKILDGNAFVIRPRPWCEALALLIRDSGRGRVIEGTTVADLDVSSTGVDVVMDHGDKISGSHAIVCCGPWLPGLMTAFTGIHEIHNKRVFGLQIGIKQYLYDWRALGWPDGGIFFLPYGRTGDYFMSIRHDEWDVTPDNPGLMPQAVEKRATDFLNAVVGTGNWWIVKSNVFMDTYSSDFVPVVKQVAEMDGLVTVISGTHGSGVRLAPGLAELAVHTCFSA
jgi:glycine/D-amino acid oxidase-like deaminating enzyme